MWRYKISVFCVFVKNTEIAKKGCGTMWHYVALSNGCFFSEFIFFEKNLKLQKKAVALCGTMWHYVALSNGCFFSEFIFFEKNLKLQKNGCGTMWHYVAL